MDPEPLPPGEENTGRMAEVEARRIEIARIASEIDGLKRQIEAERELHASVEGVDEADLEEMDEWESMSPEEQTEWIRNMRQFMENHREELAEMPGAEPLIERLERILMQQDALIHLEEQAEELVLQSHADEAEATTRLIVAMADIMKTMEKFTEDDWQDIPSANRAEMMDLLNAWNNGQREACLSQLPIEIRRRYE